ncbi:unnamed protein product [Ophioblennius macclurei]
MAFLFLMLPWLPLVLSAVVKLPKPVNVAIISEGFSHVVKWKPGPGTPVQAYYSVSIATDRMASDNLVPGCERVQHQLLCNLTEAFSDPMQTYITMVKAVLDEQSSYPAVASRFTPLNHMRPPLLTVTPCGRDLCVALEPPIERYREVYSSLNYHLRIESRGKDDTQFLVETQSLRGKTLKDLTPGRQYCVSVSFWDILEETKSNFSKPVCAYTPAVISADPWIAAGLCLLVIAAAIAVAMLVLAGFCCLRNKLFPSVLTSISHTEEDVLVPCNVSLSSLWTVKVNDTEKESRSSSPDHSDQEYTAEDSAQSTGSAYQLKRDMASFLSTSSSSSGQPESTHTHSIQQVPLLISAFKSHHSGDPRCTDEEVKDLDEDGDSQDVNLLSLRLGRFEDMENKEKLQSAEDEPPAFQVPPSLWCPEEGASGSASGCSDDEEPDSGWDYVGRPQTTPFHNF